MNMNMNLSTSESEYSDDENTVMSLTPNEEILPKCGPDSWKKFKSIMDTHVDDYDTEQEIVDALWSLKDDEIVIKKGTLVRSICESKWKQALNVLKCCTRKKMSDMFVDIHYKWNTTNDISSNDISENFIESAVVYVILSLYDGEDDEIKYAKVTSKINANIAEKKYNNEYHFDITDYILRNPYVWEKVEFIN